MIRGADLSHADICEISTELEAEENLDPQPPATFITTGAADCGGSCPRPIDTRRRLSCHISGIGLAGTWVPNSAVTPVRPACGTCAALLQSLGRPGCSGRRNCNVNLDELRGDRPDLDYEPQQAGGIPRNVQLDETEIFGDRAAGSGEGVRSGQLWPRMYWWWAKKVLGEVGSDAGEESAGDSMVRP
jgi:hypothetical protein